MLGLFMFANLAEATTGNEGNNAVQGLSGNPGFEDNSTGYTLSPAGPFSINTNTTYVRSGSKSLRLSTTSTSDQKAYHTGASATAPLTGYVTVMAWIKGENAQLNTRVGLYNSTTLTESSAGAYTTISTGSWNIISGTFACVAGQNYYPVVMGRSISGGTGTGEFDDVVMYFSASSSADVTNPGTAGTAVQGSSNGTEVTLTWTDGSDAESGLEGYLVVRLSGVSATAVNPLAQVNYSTVSTQGPNAISGATVIYNGNAATCTDDPGVAGTYTYLIFTRDKAYNYTASASPARILVTTGTGHSPQVTASMSIDGIYLPAGNTLTVTSAATLTLKTASAITIQGTLVEAGTITNYGSVTFASGSSFQFDRNGGTIIYATWQPGSLCYITGIKNTAPDGFDQTFADVTWNCTQQNRNITLDATFAVNGDFLIQSTSTRRIVLENNVLKGDLIQTGGTVWFSTGTDIFMQGSQLQELQVNGPVYGLMINNASGVHLAGNLTINEDLELIAGTFNNADYTLTLATNAGISRSLGSLQATPVYGGNIDITYNAATTTGGEIPSSGIRNLTVNTTGTVTLGADLTVSGTLAFTSGYINSSAADPLILSSAATVSGASASSHVTGPVMKTGNTAFTFPIGNGIVYAPLTISAPALITDQFTASYTRADANSIGTNLQAGLAIVSSTEYWNLQRNTGTSTVNTTLAWNSSSYVSNLSDLRVARFNGTEWVPEGNISTTGNATQGTVTSSPVSGYGTFTLGSLSYGQNWLPVQLISFTSGCTDEGTRLEWSTASEYNNHHYEIYRSANAVEYDLAGTIPAVMNSTTRNSYNFRDNDQNNNLTYYKLRQVDIDGIFEEFGPVTSNCKRRKPLYSINNNTLTFLNTELITGSRFHLRITDTAGRLIEERELQLNEGEKRFSLGKLPVQSLLICNLTDESGNYYPLKFYQSAW